MNQMNHVYRLCCFFALVAMVLCLTSCGSSGDGAGTTPIPTASPEPIAIPNPTPPAKTGAG
jgi:hypothetical protein